MLSQRIHAARAITKSTNPSIFAKLGPRKQLEASHLAHKRLGLKTTWAARRTFSTSNSPNASSSSSPIRISHVLGVLLVFGVGTTSWGLYEFYATLTMWPKEVRGDLRAGLRAKERGDLKLSQRHLTRAWETVRTLPRESLSPEPYLKISGVAIVLAEVLEADQQLDEAYAVLKTACNIFIPPKSPASSTPTKQKRPSITLNDLVDTTQRDLSKPSYPKRDTRSRMRIVAIALKMGALAEILKRPDDEERALGFAVIQVLLVIRDEYGLVHHPRRGFEYPGSETSSSEKRSPENSGNVSPNDEKKKAPKVVLGPERLREILSPSKEAAELGLPAWVFLTTSELAAPMERLGAFYTRQGKAPPAILLYRIASSLLTRPKSFSKSADPKQSPRVSPPSVVELCQALQIENAHMALLMGLRRDYPEDTIIQRDLPLVINRAVRIYDEAVLIHGRNQAKDGGHSGDIEIRLCDETYPAILFNAAVYYEEEGHLEQALRSYSLSYMALRSHGPRELAQEALENARRLQRTIDKKAKRSGSQDQSRAQLPPQSKDPHDQNKR